MQTLLFLSFVDLACISAEHLLRHCSTAPVNQSQQTLVAVLLVVGVNLRQLQVAVNLLHFIHAFRIIATVVSLQTCQQQQ